MFGQNAVFHPGFMREDYRINSLFYTVQGEGPWMGYPAIFVRFSQCNLRCFFCDTEFERGVNMHLDQLVTEIEAAAVAARCHRIVFTGGEPFLQALGPLFAALPERLVFQIETAGTVWTDISKADLNRTLIVVSPKTPNINEKVLEHASAFKYIIRAGAVSDADGLPNMSTQKRGEAAMLFRPPPRFTGRIYVQPMDEVDDAEATKANTHAAAASAMRYGYRLSLQMHKRADLP